MERRVSVNAEAVPAITPDGLPQGWSEPAGSRKRPPEIELPSARPAPAGQGPCLYLGPGGERCRRQALAGGFCAAHGTQAPAAFPARFWAAAAAIAALLWPYVEFVVREIIRWARSR
ncbi:MAG TPA: hypothetical protein VEI55_02195 [Candidatus Acidoferrum sp.]|nr:hypothetical protein [Candidatus Acidoferrum sp.]